MDEPTHVIKVVIDIQNEICKLRKHILECEAEILRKQMAIEEVVITQVQTAEKPFVDIKNWTAPRMIDAVLAEMNGESFTLLQLRDRIIARWPDSRHKISTQIYKYRDEYVEKKILIQNPDKTLRKNHAKE